MPRSTGTARPSSSPPGESEKEARRSVQRPRPLASRTIAASTPGSRSLNRRSRLDGTSVSRRTRSARWASSPSASERRSERCRIQLAPIRETVTSRASSSREWSNSSPDRTVARVSHRPMSPSGTTATTRTISRIFVRNDGVRRIGRYTAEPASSDGEPPMSESSSYFLISRSSRGREIPRISAERDL